MPTAVYPGTFDPITRGHVDIVERAARLFDRVIVAVAIGRHKKPGLSLDERRALARNALHHLPTVEVKGFDGLLAEFAIQCGASVVIRGLRTSDDLRHELAMAGTNRAMRRDLQTMFVPASEDCDHISSTIVRELTAHGIDVSRHGLSPERAKENR